MLSRRWVLPLMIGITLAGCCTVRPQPRRIAATAGDPDGAEPPGAPPCASTSTERQIFLAQLSVLYYANSALRGRAIPDVTPVPLEQAAHWLRCAPEEPRQRTRIRYAVIKLAATVVATSGQPGGIDPALINPMIAGLRTLIGPSHLLAQLSHAGLTDVGQLQDQAGILIDGSAEPALVALQRTGCCACIDQCVVGENDNESLAEFTIKVNRSPQCIFHVVDPQCWPAVTAGHFTDVFVVGNGPACQGTTPVCRSTDICDTTLPAPQKDTMPAAPGTPWCGLVYEDITADSGATTARFRNVLKANLASLPGGAASTAATGIRLDYGLCESRYWEMCGTECADGTCAIDRDCGHAQVEDTGTGAALIDGSKHIHFTSRPTFNCNNWAPLALEVLVQETAGAACSRASECPGAAAPGSCAEPSSTIECQCPHDHCESQQETIGQTKPTTLCP